MRPATLRRLLLLSALVSACGPKDAGSESTTGPRVPGELLGTYAIEGRIRGDSCGAALLGAPNPWRFEVKLSRKDHDLYWLNGREAIVGDLAKDGLSFTFDTRVNVPIGGDAKSTSCVVSRRDRAQGDLVADNEEVLGLNGTMSFDYSSKSELGCIEIIGIPGSVETLPCSLTYTVVGELKAK